MGLFRAVARTARTDRAGWTRLFDGLVQRPNPFHAVLVEGTTGERRASVCHHGLVQRPNPAAAASVASPRLFHAALVEGTERRASGQTRVRVQHLAQTGEGLRDGEIVEWLVRPGDAVKQYDLLCRVQSDKATIDVSSAYDGTIHSLSGSVGDILAVGEPLCAFSVEDHEDHEDHEDVGGEDGPSEDKRGARDDCELKDAEDATLDSLRGFAPDGSLKRKLTSYRRSMMHAMQQASDIPHCHALDIVTGLDKISTPIAVKALSRAVECVPIMHALLSPEDESYTIPAGVHVGVAVSTPSGLAVPCLRDAQQKSVEEIGADIARLRRLAIDRRLSRDDTEGGTITLSNIGSVGLISGLGIIQPKQTALVTVGKAVNGTAHVSVSADHRLVDGLTLAEFLAAFRRALCDEASARELGRADEPV